jgi:hypothetical protein
MSAVTEDGVTEDGDVRLDWGIRPSFLAYVDALPDGEVRTDRGASRSGARITFSGGHRTECGFRFDGRVGARGHFGVLDVDFRTPELVLDDDGGPGRLLVTVGDEPLEMATFTIGEATSSGMGQQCLLSAADVRLTADGAWLLGGVYSPGAEAAPVTVFTVDHDHAGAPAEHD